MLRSALLKKTTKKKLKEVHVSFILKNLFLQTLKLFNFEGSIPGCNITNFPKNLNRSQCCLSKPKSFNQSAAAVCKADSPKTDNRTELACYWSKCMLKQSGYTNQDGKFDSAIAAAKLESSTKKIDIWKPIINATVDKCVAAGKFK